MASTNQFSDCNSMKEVHNKLMTSFCCDYFDVEINRRKFDIFRVKSFRYLTNPVERRMLTPYDVLEMLERKGLLGVNNYSVLTELVNDIDIVLNSMIADAADKIVKLAEEGNQPVHYMQMQSSLQHQDKSSNPKTGENRRTLGHVPFYGFSDVFSKLSGWEEIPDEELRSIMDIFEKFSQGDKILTYNDFCRRQGRMPTVKEFSRYLLIIEGNAKKECSMKTPGDDILAEDIRQLKDKHPLAQFVVCRRGKTFGEMVVIGYDSYLKHDETFPMEKSGIDVVFKNPYITSDEAVLVNNERFMKERMNYDFNILNYLKECIEEHASDLWKTHSNLTIITGDYFKCTGGVSSIEPCIVFYCLSKGFIPFNEEPFPTELTFRACTFKTDVREGYFTLGPTTMRGYPDSFNDPICMGSNIGNQCMDASGSLGLFVDLPHNGKGFLTCCHVLFDCVKPREFSFSHIYGSEVQHVIQPGKSAFCSNTDTACGEILRATFCPGRLPVSVDAALVKVIRRIPLTGHFVIKTVPQVKEIGYDLDALPVFDTGRVRRKISKHDLEKPLLKSGTSSGLTRSLFRLDGAQVRIIEEGAWLGMDEQLPITMKGQYEVESGSKEPGSLNKPFFIPGDSGSAVFAKENDGTLTCIGIAIGITSYGTTVVTPIGAVLDALNLKDTDVTTFS